LRILCATRDRVDAVFAWRWEGGGTRSPGIRALGDHMEDLVVVAVVVALAAVAFAWLVFVEKA
jgi:hypothetical protein